MQPVIIIGGGISGLSTAYYLSCNHLPSLLIESQPRLGGVIETVTREGCTLEAGPDSFISIKPAAMELIKELGMAADVIGSNDHLRVTYIWKRGNLVPLPDGLMMMVPTRIMPMVTSPLLGWATKFRMGMEWFRKPSSAVQQDRSVADFIRDHYGQEAVDYLAEPLLSGVYGGDPRALSVNSVLTRFVDLERKYGSLTKGVLAARKAMKASESVAPLFRTLRNGLGTLVSELEKRIAGVTRVIHGTAVRLEMDAGHYRVHVNGDCLESSHVVLACPAYAAAALLRGVDEELPGLLDSVPYSSSITLSLGYRQEDLPGPLNGFGFLIPKTERKKLVACTWVGTKFSYRVPDGMAVLRCFLGGTDDSVMNESDDALIMAVRDELRAIMGLHREPRFIHMARWPRAMAQYTVGHEARYRRILNRLSALPGLYVAGNAYTGIGIPDCIRMGREAAHAIQASQAAGSAAFS